MFRLLSGVGGLGSVHFFVGALSMAAVVLICPRGGFDLPDRCPIGARSVVFGGRRWSGGVWQAPAVKRVKSCVPVSGPVLGPSFLQLLGQFGRIFRDLFLFFVFALGRDLVEAAFFEGILERNASF